MQSNVGKTLSNASAMLGNLNAVLSNASAMLSHASSILSNAITMLSNAVQYKAMLRNTYTMQEQILIEWWALLCTQRPICSRVCLISKKFLSSIIYLSSIPPTLVLGAASLQLALKNPHLKALSLWNKKVSCLLAHDVHKRELLSLEPKEKKFFKQQ